METYSVVNDFTEQNPNIGQLYDEIQNSSITEFLERISQYSDIVQIVFTHTISPAEKTILDSIVSSHVADNTPSTIHQMDIIINANTKSSGYKRFASAILPKSSYARAESISWIDDPTGSYTILLYDKTNKQILLETTLSNSVETVQQLGELNNLSNNRSQIEISLKRNGNKGKAYLENITIHYI